MLGSGGCGGQIAVARLALLFALEANQINIFVVMFL